MHVHSFRIGNRPGQNDPKYFLCCKRKLEQPGTRECGTRECKGLIEEKNGPEEEEEEFTVFLSQGHGGKQSLLDGCKAQRLLRGSIETQKG